MKIRILGDFAIVHAATSYTMPDGQDGRGRYTDCRAGQDGKWLAVSALVTRRGCPSFRGSPQRRTRNDVD